MNEMEQTAKTLNEIPKQVEDYFFNLMLIKLGLAIAVIIIGIIAIKKFDKWLNKILERLENINKK